MLGEAKATTEYFRLCRPGCLMWHSWLTVVDRLMKHQKKRWPAGTTWLQRTVSEWTTRATVDVFNIRTRTLVSVGDHFLYSSRCSSFHWGLSSVPWYIITVDRPSLSTAIRTPKVVHSWSTSCTCTDCAYVRECDGQQERNSPDSGLSHPGSSLATSRPYKMPIFWKMYRASMTIFQKKLEIHIYLENETNMYMSQAATPGHCSPPMAWELS